MRGRLILVACPKEALDRYEGLWATKECPFWCHSCYQRSTLQWVELFLSEAPSNATVILAEAFFLVDSRTPKQSNYTQAAHKLLHEALSRGINIVLVAPGLHMMHKYLREHADCQLQFQTPPSDLVLILKGVMHGLGDRLWDILDIKKTRGGDKGEV